MIRSETTELKTYSSISNTEWDRNTLNIKVYHKYLKYFDQMATGEILLG